MSREKRILEQVARQQDVSVDEVRKEIEIAIAAAQNNPDPEIQKRWKKMKFKHETPTPEEFLKYLAKELNVKQK